MQKNNDIYQKMAALEQIMDWFESEDFLLEESLEKFAEAEKIAKEIDLELESFQNKVTILQKKFSEENK